MKLSGEILEEAKSIGATHARLSKDGKLVAMFYRRHTDKFMGDGTKEEWQFMNGMGMWKYSDLKSNEYPNWLVPIDFGEDK
ncbi:MAG: hypothetical protein ACRCVU_05075 [Flavobacterium sp.]